jgi:hypothetical protein
MGKEPRYEYCGVCGEATGRAGRADDSLYLANEDDVELGPLCEKCHDAFRRDDLEAELARLRESEARGNETRHWLRELLVHAKSALTNAPKDCFGVAGDGASQWYLVDELVSRIDAALDQRDE